MRRLARGRALLAARLTRPGVALTAGLLAARLNARADVSTLLAVATVKSVVRAVAGSGTGGG